MRDIIERNPLALVIAVVMHVVIIAFMLVGVDWLEKPIQPKSNVDIVQAKMINQSKVDAEVAKLKKSEETKKAKEKKRLADVKRKQNKEKKKLADLEKKRKAREKKAKTEAKKRKAAEKKKKLAAEKKRKTEAKKKLEVEKKRKAAVKKKLEAEKERKVEAKKKEVAEKKRKAAEAKKKVEAEKKRKVAEAAVRQAAEKKALEDALQAALESERMATERDQFLFKIKQKIQNHWLRPTTVGDGLSCQLRVRLISGGGIASVAITRSSGNGAFDRSVEKAVYKADPLPVPKGAGFEAFRDLNLIFDPSK